MTSTPTAFRTWFLVWVIIAGSFLPNLLRAQALVQPLHAFGFPESSVAQPCGRLIENTNGQFIGISFAGGKDGYGSFFRMNRDGTGLIVLYSFYPTATNAGGPVYLIKGSDGRYYGVSRGGGKNGYGTVFSINADGSGCNVLYMFRGPSNQDGAFPNYLMEASDGTLFGTTDASLGTLFRLNKDGTGYSLVGGFGYTTGMLPKPGLFESSDGWLYGITWTWGTNYGGTIFKLRKDGSNFTIMRHLGPGDRNNTEPYAPQFLIQRERRDALRLLCCTVAPVMIKEAFSE